MTDRQLTLGEKQRVFVRLLPKLIGYAYDAGYEISLGEAYRTDEQAEINALGPTGRGRLADYIGGLFPGLAAKIRLRRPRAVALRDAAP